MADKNPLLQQVFQEGEYERILRKLPKQLHKELSQNDSNTGLQFIQALQQRGVLKNLEPEVMVGVIRAVLMLRLQKEKLGSELFPRIMNFIIDCVAEGLTNSK